MCLCNIFDLIILGFPEYIYNEIYVDSGSGCYVVFFRFPDMATSFFGNIGPELVLSLSECQVIAIPRAHGITVPEKWQRIVECGRKVIIEEFYRRQRFYNEFHPLSFLLKGFSCICSGWAEHNTPILGEYGLGAVGDASFLF